MPFVFSLYGTRSLLARAAHVLVLSAPLMWSAVAGRADAAPLTMADTPAARLAAFALLEQLNADLLSHDSATLTLDRWCAAHHLATPATVVAHQDKPVDKPASDAQRRALGVGANEPIRYRRVRLFCGSRVLSEADNWYVPGRLTPAMNTALDTSEVAFGRAIQSLNFRRHTLSAELLWRPVPEGWETGAPWPRAEGPLMTVPDAVLQHRALLVLPDGSPVSEVVETYTSAVLDFPISPLPSK